MGKGLPYSLVAGPEASRPFPIKKDISFATPITVDGATGIGFGSIPLIGLPANNLLLQVAVCSIAFAGSGSDAGLGDTWSGDFGIGTTPADDGTITAGDVDIIGSTAIGPATAEAIAAVGANNITAALIDNTAGLLEVNLNLLVDDLDISADGVLITATGQLSFCYIVLQSP